MRKLTQKELVDISRALDRDFRSLDQQYIIDQLVDKLARQLFNKSFDELEGGIVRRERRGVA